MRNLVARIYWGSKKTVEGPMMQVPPRKYVYDYIHWGELPAAVVGADIFENGKRIFYIPAYEYSGSGSITITVYKGDCVRVTLFEGDDGQFTLGEKKAEALIPA